MAENNNRKELERALNEFGDLIYRTSFIILGNQQDAEDVLQDTFIRYMEKSPVFKDYEHQKAWLLKVSHNLCKDLLRFKKRHTYVNIDEVEKSGSLSIGNEVIKYFISLPPKYKITLILFYVEGFQVSEISKIINISESAVKKRLQRGRNLIKVQLEEK